MPLEPAAGRAARIAHRAIALSCPRCGGTKLFSGWFAMRASCALCGLYFERAQGYWVGGIYINYGATVTIAIWIPFLLLFPLWFFRYSRSLWLALEFCLNPEP